MAWLLSPMAASAMGIFEVGFRGRKWIEFNGSAEGGDGLREITLGEKRFGPGRYESRRRLGRNWMGAAD